MKVFKQQNFWYLFLAVVATSCKWFTPVETDRVKIARAYDNYLYLDEIKPQIPRNISSDDSAVIANSLINNWIEKQVILHNAEQNLNEEKKNVEQQLKEYRNDLIIYTYQSELVDQKLDTLVSNGEIETYYEQNKDNFELKDYIVKVVYVKLDSNAPQISKVKKWVNSKDEADFHMLEDYCHQFAANYYLDVNNWLYFNDLLKEIPFETFDKERIVRSTQLIELEKSGYVYFVKIKEFRLKDGTSPLVLERNKIKRIILNQRKQALIARMKKDLFQRAEEKNEFEFYTLE
ncbi:MAG: hypothetical protein CL843_13510 [Crocinitomicaceae bacterium]|nr:hypothetical protein [Crocinitomicaceae bacterium]